MTSIARVKSRKGFRKGRGFSEEEIKKAGLTVAMAKKLKIAIDSRRKSAYNSNVSELKKLKPPEKKPKIKKAVKAPKKAVKEKKPEKKVTKRPVKKAKEKPKKPAKKPVKKKAAPKPKATKSKKK